jgi:hypothetical protein
MVKLVWLLWSMGYGEIGLVEPLANVGKCLGNWACGAFCGVWGMVKLVWLFGGVSDCLGLCGLLWSIGNGEACVAFLVE